MILKTLLVMGLQRETASRGTLATYTSVRLFTLQLFSKCLNSSRLSLLSHLNSSFSVLRLLRCQSPEQS